MIDVKEARYNEEGGIIVELNDGSFLGVPNDPKNRHFVELEEWTAAGGVIQPFVPPVVEVFIDPLQDKLIQLEAAVNVLKRDAKTSEIDISNEIDTIKGELETDVRKPIEFHAQSIESKPSG